MKPVDEGREQYEFYFPEVDVHVLVENHPDEVLLRASSQNFSERRKIVFIRHLAAEGFIPTHYRWFAECASSGFAPIRWVVDTTWLKIHPELTRRTTRFMRALLIEAGLLWLAVLTLIFLHSS